jgi:hypothetical protein
MPPDVRGEYDRILSQHIAEDAKQLSGQQLKDLITELGQLSGDLTNAGTAMEKRASRVIGEQRGKLKEFFPLEVQALDDSYTKFIRFQEASRRTLQPEEGITPRVYQQAVRGESQGNQFARGEAPGQGLSDPAQILKQSSNSGMSTLASGGAVGLASLLGMTPAALAAMVASIVGSTRAGAKLAFGNTDAQRYMADVLRRTRGMQAATGATVAENNRPKTLNEWR